MAATLEGVLVWLADEDQRLPGADFKLFSNLSRSETATVRATWQRLTTGRRRAAIARLADLAEDNLDFNFDSIFTFCIDDSDPDVRRRAIGALWESEDRALIAPLIDHLTNDPEPSVRGAAAQALGRFALLGAEGKLRASDLDQVEAALFQVIGDRDLPVEVRRRAVEAISVSENARVPGIIEEAYHSSDPEMRASAIHAMGRTVDVRWLPVLLEELNSDEPAYRYEAATACGELEAEVAVPRLIELIEDPDEEVQAAAILALGEIGGRVARQVLQRLLHHSDERLRDLAEDALELMSFGDSPLGLDLH